MVKLFVTDVISSALGLNCFYFSMVNLIKVFFTLTLTGLLPAYTVKHNRRVLKKARIHFQTHWQHGTCGTQNKT